MATFHIRSHVINNTEVEKTFIIAIIFAEWRCHKYVDTASNLILNV